MSDIAWLDKPIFLAGHRKSGTTLLLSLFDNHEQISVFPPDSGFWYAYYPRYASDEYSDAEKIQRIIDVSYGNFRADYINVDESAGNAYPYDDLIEKFRNLMEGRECSPSIIIQTVIEAFEANNPVKRGVPRCWIEKTTSTEIYASEVFDWFPHAKMIHLIRDPRDNYASLKSGWDKRYKDMNDSHKRLLQSMLDRGGLGLKLAKVNEFCFDTDRYKVIRYEDLTANPKAIMQELAAFVGIDYANSLVQPTYCGISWKGNNFDGLKFDKPSNINVGRWKERIDESDAKLIEFYLHREMKEWGYTHAFSLSDTIESVREHYKWFNSTQQYLDATPTKTNQVSGLKD